MQHGKTILVCAFATLGACGTEVEREQNEPSDVTEVMSELTNCPSTYSNMCFSVQDPCCSDSTTSTSCAGGTWRGGVVSYKFADAADVMANPTMGSVPTSAEQTMFRQGMDDWTFATNGVITFAANASVTPHVKIFAVSSGGYTSDCFANPNGCVLKSGPDSVYHELGHLFYAIHHFSRNDRRHYHMTRGAAASCDARCNTDERDFGPFDYKSTMYYRGSFPTFSRYDGSKVCGTVSCGAPGSPGCTGTAPPSCPDGLACATCATCSKNQPQGLPSANDGAAVVELYRNALEPGWKKFRRTVNEVTTGTGATTPFDYKLATGVKLSTVDPTPALATWGGTDLAMFVLGTNKRIYGKWKLASNPVSWSTWADLGCCFNSAPSAVSWASGRTDVVARGEDNAIYINTETPGAWTGWQSLGGSAGSGPAITSWGANRLDVFVKSSSNGDLLVKSCSANCSGASGTWTSGWQANFPNGGLVGKPAVVSRGSGLIDIYVHGGDHRLYANQYYNGVAGSWSLVANGPLQWDAARPDLFSPAAAARNQDYIEVFARGVAVGDNKLSVITWTGTWSPWKVLGGVLASAPGTVSKVRDSARSDVGGVMTEETSFNAALASGVWWKEYSP